MRLRLSDQGDRKDSDNLVAYLLDYLEGLVKSLVEKECFTTAEIIENEIASVRRQRFQALQHGTFVIGWGS